MKKLIILLFLLICCSCTQHLIDDKGIVTRIEMSSKDRVFNVYLKEINVEINGGSLCVDFFDFPKTFYFETKTPYHIGDTIKFAKL